MFVFVSSLALGAAWDHPPTPAWPFLLSPDAATEVQEWVARHPTEQVGADLAREASRMVAAWYVADLPILDRGEYGGQVADLRDDLARHVSLLDDVGVTEVSRGRGPVAQAVREAEPLQTRGGPVGFTDWRPSGALQAWIEQLDHLATVAERQAFGRAPGDDGGAARLAADARWLRAGFAHLRLAGC
ncbi:MAG: hypothetical protein AAF602_11695 [Myxococcota bacterium]